LPSRANFLLCELPEHLPTAAEFLNACRARGLYLRDVSSMSTRFDARALRVAVKDAATTERMLTIIRDVSADPEIAV
jgi:histidinol-phosphate/aromatic aminotransferase/cobyric acid decarboxylase-like protein